MTLSKTREAIPVRISSCFLSCSSFIHLCTKLRVVPIFAELQFHNTNHHKAGDSLRTKSLSELDHGNKFFKVRKTQQSFDNFAPLTCYSLHTFLQHGDIDTGFYNGQEFAKSDSGDFKHDIHGVKSTVDKETLAKDEQLRRASETNLGNQNQFLVG